MYPSSSKVCFKCGAEKPLDEFYRHPRMSDGHLGKCKACAKADSITHRAVKTEYYREYDRERLQSDPKRRKQHRKDTRLYRQRHPEKAHAHAVTSGAIRRGRLGRQPCEVCGARAQAHHEDYSQALAVRWLCQEHHHAHHRGRLKKAG